MYGIVKYTNFYESVMGKIYWFYSIIVYIKLKGLELTFSDAIWLFNIVTLEYKWRVIRLHKFEESPRALNLINVMT